MFAIDLTNATERVFPALGGVEAVDGALEWVERADGLHVRAEPAPPGSLGPGLPGPAARRVGRRGAAAARRSSPAMAIAEAHHRRGRG